jgi:hypothetical protein
MFLQSHGFLDETDRNAIQLIALHPETKSRKVLSPILVRKFDADFVDEALADLSNHTGNVDEDMRSKLRKCVQLRSFLRFAKDFQELVVPSDNDGNDPDVDSTIRKRDCGPAIWILTETMWDDLPILSV